MISPPIRVAATSVSIGVAEHVTKRRRSAGVVPCGFHAKP
jgi:hypothetical protein